MSNQEKFQVTELRFKAIKILLESGSSTVDCAAYMGCGTTTIKRISMCETFADYKQLMAAVAIENKARKERQKAAALASTSAPVKPAVPAASPAPVQQEQPTQVIEHRQSVTIQATHYMESELKKQTELLTIISKKLAAIIDDLYGVKEAK